MDLDKEPEKTFQLIVKTENAQIEFVVDEEHLDDAVNQWHTIVFDEFPTLLLDSLDGRVYRFNKKKVIYMSHREL
jgi:hypothetical protein